VDGNSSNYQKMKILLGMYDTTGDKRLKDILSSSTATSTNKNTSTSSSSSSLSLLKRNSLVKIPALINSSSSYSSSLREFSFGPQYDSTDCNISYSEYYSYYCCCSDGVEGVEEKEDEVDQSVSTQTQLTDVLTATTTGNATTTIGNATTVEEEDDEGGVVELIKKYSSTSSTLDSLAVEFQKEFHFDSATNVDLNGLIGKGWDLLMELKRIQDDRINLLLKEEEEEEVEVVDISSDELIVYMECKSIVLELIKRMEGQQVVVASKKQGVDYGSVVYRNEYGYNGVMKDGGMSGGGMSGGDGSGMIPPQLLPKGGI
jgi:hypothetical protein